MRDVIARQVFKIEPEKLRVITPDVGGGFGTKSFVYREYPLVLEAAKRLGRPVKWAGDRTEHFLTDAQGRDNCRRRPRWRSTRTAASSALRVDLIANMGAYLSQYGPFIPYIGATMSTGVYDIQALDVDDRTASTPTPSRSTPIAAPGGRRRRSCSRGWSTTARATLGIAPRRDPPPQFHPAGAVPLPDRRPAGSTTSASSTAT